MANEWIIDVLADLRQYALRHHYMSLAEQLDDAIVTAAGELMIEAEEMETIDIVIAPMGRRAPLMPTPVARAPRHLAAVT